MVNISLLKSAIEASGMTTKTVCERAGIERTTMYSRYNGKGEFTSTEIVNLSKVLGLTKPERDKIFLC